MNDQILNVALALGLIFFIVFDVHILVKKAWHLQPFTGMLAVLLAVLEALIGPAWAAWMFTFVAMLYFVPWALQSALRKTPQAKDEAISAYNQLIADARAHKFTSVLPKKTVSCANCGAPNEVPEEALSHRCEHCGSDALHRGVKM